MSQVAMLQCPGCNRDVYDWAAHVTCLFYKLEQLAAEVEQLKRQNYRLVPLKGAHSEEA